MALPIFTTTNYDARNWYWVVNGQTDKVWSSARMQYVDIADPNYVAWLGQNHQPVRIDSQISLLEVMRSQTVPAILARGVSIVSARNSDLNGTYAADSAAQQTIVALSTGIAAGKQLPGGQRTFDYPDMDGVPHAFTADDFVAFASAVENYIYSLGQSVSWTVFGNDSAIPSNTLMIP